MSRSVLLLARIDEDVISNHGIVEKLKGQARAHEKLGWSTDVIINRAQCIYLNGEPFLDRSSSPSTLFAYRWYELIKQKILEQSYDLLWIRYGLSTPAFISFLKAYKAKYPQVKVVIDMPTYPYQQEWQGLKGRIVLAMDRYYAKQLNAQVDLVLHSGPEPDIFNIPTHYMTNGIELMDSPAEVAKAKSQPIKLLAIGKWQYWHGLDRVISALQRDLGFELHIVGDGPALTTIRKEVKQLNFDNEVHFHGALIGAPLRDLMNQCDIGVGTLGIHRKAVNINSSLKHRTYCAAALPFIFAGTDPDFSEDCEFVYVCPENDDPVDLTEIKKFYNRLKPSTYIRVEMIAYAKKHLSWTSRVEQIHDKIF